MDELECALGFSYFEGIGPKKYLLLLKRFGDAKNAWTASEKDLLEVLGKTFGSRFISFRKSFNSAKIQQELKKFNTWAVSFGSKDYPLLLREISDPPIVIFGRGEKSLLTSFNDRYIGVVGTRKISSYGKEVTQMMVEGLVNNEYCIVSGLAMGVDACAHETALSNKGKTIAVLGCGPDYCYPRENIKLYEKILAEGSTIISEYPPQTLPSIGSFPSRNRIIAGISKSILVTQGAYKSGSLITASITATLGRLVFAVPGPITSSLSQGSNDLLKNGAEVVGSVADILDKLGTKKMLSYKNRPKGETKKEQILIDALSKEELSFDEIISMLKFKPNQLSNLLSVLELKGVIYKNSEGNFLLIT